MPQFDFYSFFIQSFQFSLSCGLFYLLGLYYFQKKLMFTLLLRQKICALITEKNIKNEKLLDKALSNIFIK